MTNRLSKIELASRMTVRKWERVKVLLEAGEYGQAEDLADNDVKCGFCKQYYYQDLSYNCGYSCTSCPLYKLRRKRCYNWKEWNAAEDNGNIKSWLKLVDVVIAAAKKVVE